MEQYADKTLFGIHIGEHGFDATKVMDELRECVEKGINFVTIRPIRGPQGNVPVPDHYYYEWAEYMTAHQIYFVFLYALQEAPEGQESHLTPEINENLKRIAGKYYLGDMLGETGSTYACKLRGYFGDDNDPDLPPQNAKNMKEAKENYSSTLKDLVDRERATGVPNVVTVEATMLNNYNVEMGTDMPFSEIPCGDPETVIPALRGTARAYDAKLWGTYIAHEWYAGMRHFDRLKDARFELTYKYAYLQGSQVFCLESGLSNIHSYGTKLPHDNPISIKNREVFYRLGRYMIDDDRPAGGPVTRVAFVQGNHDGYGGGWGGSSLWAQFEGEQWGHSDAEHGWRIVNDVNKRRDWWEPDSYEARGRDVSGSLNGGVYDIIPASAPLDVMSQYDTLVFVGWNTMTEEILTKLEQFVENGGKLLLSAAHLNACPKRKIEFKPIRGGDLSRLCGCKLTGETVNYVYGMKFRKESLVEGVRYPTSLTDRSDPTLSSGCTEYAVAEPTDGTVIATIENSFHFVGNPGFPSIIEKKLGKGHVILTLNSSYPGRASIYPLYSMLVKSLMHVGVKQASVRVIGPDTLRYTVYEDGSVYLLNTDLDTDYTVELIDGDKSERIHLDSLELKHIKLGHPVKA